MTLCLKSSRPLVLLNNRTKTVINNTITVPNFYCNNDTVLLFTV